MKRPADAWIQSAHRHLDAARFLVRDYPEWSSTAAYYAVYSLVRAVLTPNAEPKRHAIIPKLLTQCCADLHYSWGRRFDAMQRLRVRCSYGGYVPSSEEAQETVSDVETLVQEAHAFLRA